MIKLKSLKKKLLKLEASLQKDAKKLAKLKRKVETALSAESGRLKPVTGVRNGSTSVKPVSPAASKKRALTPEGRAKLSALMKARWAAKRAATVPFVDPQRVEA
jgi:hypothetical protein